jgi:hypothetical protein
VIRKLEEAVMIDATDGEACAFAGIGETADYDEKERTPTPWGLPSCRPRPRSRRVM